MTDPDILRLWLERAMATMEARSRTVFRLHRLEALSYDEIAARLGLTLMQVEQHIADAILHLDRELTAMERRGRG